MNEVCLSLSPGKPLALHAMGFRPVPRDDGLFDLMAYGKGSPFSGGTTLIYFQNTGTKGKPAFDTPEPVPVGQSTLVRALGMSPGGWSLHDFDEDGVLDLLISGGSGMTNAYYPRRRKLLERQSVSELRSWSWLRHHGQLAGRSEHDLAILGAWSKKRRATHYRSIRLSLFIWEMGDFQVQWRFYSPIIAPDVLESSGKQYIVLSGDMDKIVALPFVLANGDLRCQPAEPLLVNSGALKEAYWVDSVDCVDVTGDGVQEVVVTGNTRPVGSLERHPGRQL